LSRGRSNTSAIHLIKKNKLNYSLFLTTRALAEQSERQSFFHLSINNIINQTDITNLQPVNSLSSAPNCCNISRIPQIAGIAKTTESSKEKNRALHESKRNKQKHGYFSTLSPSYRKRSLTNSDPKKEKKRAFLYPFHLLQLSVLLLGHLPPVERLFLFPSTKNQHPCYGSRFHFSTLWGFPSRYSVVEEREERGKKLLFFKNRAFGVLCEQRVWCVESALSWRFLRLD